MLKFITNLFTKKHEAPTAPAPYKVETPKTVDTTPKATAGIPAVKARKPAVKKATTKPRKPQAPKA
jgi:heme-binding NEAT domain protein